MDVMHRTNWKTAVNQNCVSFAINEPCFIPKNLPYGIPFAASGAIIVAVVFRRHAFSSLTIFHSLLSTPVHSLPVRSTPIHSIPIRSAPTRPDRSFPIPLPSYPLLSNPFRSFPIQSIPILINFSKFSYLKQPEASAVSVFHPTPLPSGPLHSTPLLSTPFLSG